MYIFLFKGKKNDDVMFEITAFILKGSEKKREKLSSSVRAVRKGMESKDNIPWLLTCYSTYTFTLLSWK